VQESARHEEVHRNVHPAAAPRHHSDRCRPRLHRGQAIRGLVTVELTEVDGGTRLDYQSIGLTAEQEKSIKPGVATMLRHMASYFAS
jgi:hypothetical protein